MSASQSLPAAGAGAGVDPARDFINALAKRIALRSLAPQAEAASGQTQKTPSSKKVIEKSLLKITDAELKDSLESNIDYFEKLLDLTIAQNISDAQDESLAGSATGENYMCLNAPNFYFKDILTLSKSSSRVTVDELISSVYHASGCTPQQIASALVSAQEWPETSSSNLVKLFYSRLALNFDKWSESTAAWESCTFLLAFAACHACRSSAACDNDPCWAVMVTHFKSLNCFSFAGYFSYWMLSFASKGIDVNSDNVSFALKKLLLLFTSTRKHSESLVADLDDCIAPVSCLLTQQWLQSVETSPGDKKQMLREVYTFMRQWEGGDNLSTLWDLLAAVCGVDRELNDEVYTAGSAKCTGRYVNFAGWFIEQEDLANGAMKFVEASVSDSKHAEFGLDSSDFNEEIDIMIDGKAAVVDEDGTDGGDKSEDENNGDIDFEGSDSTSEKGDDGELPVTFFLDKKGDSLITEENSSDNSQIVAELGDLGVKSSKMKKKRKASLDVVDENNEVEESRSTKKSSKSQKKSKVAMESGDESGEDETALKKPVRSTRSTRSSLR